MQKLQPPLKKIPPIIPSNPPSKYWDPAKPSLFENLVGGSTQTPVHK